jgi:hypothetical protein
VKPIRDEYRACLNATADAESRAAPAALSRFVRLSSERVRQAVRQDCSFAKKQASPLRSWSSSRASTISCGDRTIA